MTRKRIVQLSMLFAFLVWPFLSSSSSLVGNANTAGLFFLPAVSLVMHGAIAVPGDGGRPG